MISDTYIETLFDYNMEDGDMTNDSYANSAIEAIDKASDDFVRAISLWLKPSRETSLALTDVEQAVMWAKRSIEKNGVSGE